jgi:hypothetical protein
MPIAQERAEQLVKDRPLLVEMLRKAAKLQQKYVNYQTRDREYDMGDKVWLSRENVCIAQPSHKLKQKCYGPFEVF